MLAQVVRRAAVGCALLAVAALSGCATVTGGTGPQKVKVESDPPGATVLVDGRPHGVTPTTVALDRTVGHRIELDKDGYAPTAADLKPGVNPWVFGNLLVGGLVGIVVDLATDSERRLYPGGVDIHLAPAAGTTPGLLPSPPLR
jgi:PEGA domain